MLDDLALLTNIWWALAINRRYRDAGLVSFSFADVKREVDKLGTRFFTHALPSVGRALDEFHAKLSMMSWVEADSLLLRETSLLDFSLKRAVSGCPVAVDYVRQLAFLFYKLEVPYDRTLVASFLDEFVKTDSELARDVWDEAYLAHRSQMRRLIGQVLEGTTPREISPSHGNGATACRTKNADKYHQLRYFPILDATYSYGDYFFASSSHLCDELDSLETSVEGVPLARLVTVPKDSRGPRLISCEPAEHMYVQQGLMKLLYRHLETHHLTRGYLNFTDQSINRTLAELSSMDGSMATIDLKDASDRVSLHLVQELFPDNWLECLIACRTPATLLPDGRVVQLQKFAPMGSSVCFPVEALVFWASAVVTQRMLGSSKPEAYVYGDDIIVPTRYAEAVMSDLTGLQLKVNLGKSYKTGPFRESCGGDYYNGKDVTPVRLKHVLDSSVLGLTRAADFLNELIKKFGLVDTIVDVVDQMQLHCRYTFPRTMLDVPCTLRAEPVSSNDVFFRRRHNNDYQRFEHLIIMQRCTVIERHPPNWGEVLRWFLTHDKVDQDQRLVSDGISASEPVLPGFYTDPRSVRKSWKWTWLG